MFRRAAAPPPGLPELQTLAAAASELCNSFDPESISLPDAPAAYELLARVEKLVSGAKVRMARRVDDAGAAAHAGARDTAEYLARLSGTSIGSARQALETSRQLRQQPRVDEAVRQGELSAPQATVIADATAATADDGTAARLIEEARQTSYGELQAACGRAKAATDPDLEARHRRVHARRFLRRGTDGDGAWTIHGNGTVDAGAAVDSVLEPLIDELFHQARRQGRREPRQAYAFDALVELCRRAGGTAVPGGGDGGTAPARPRHLAVLRVDLEALIRGSVEGEEQCEIAGLGPVPVSVARSLLGESILKLLVTRGRDVVNVTHLGRGASAAQQVALLWSSPGCQVLGCPRVARLQNDHRVPFAECHETALANLDRLCTHHHDRKTHDGWALVPGTGKRPMVSPDDPCHPRYDAHGPPARAPDEPTLFERGP